MLLVIAFLLCVFSIAAHEFGHAITMRNRGVEIKDFGIGLPVPFLPYITLVKKKRLGFPIHLHPIMILGYVEVSAKGMETMKKLPYGEKAIINSAGIWANFMYALALFLIVGILHSSETLTLGSLGVMTILLVGRKLFSKYLVIPVGIIALAYTIYSIVYPSPGGDTLMGPIGMAKDVGLHVLTFEDALIYPAALSTSIGLFNTIPIMPLDGGQIVSSLLPPDSKLLSPYRSVGTFAIILLFMWTCGSDIVHLFR